MRSTHFRSHTALLAVVACIATLVGLAAFGGPMTSAAWGAVMLGAMLPRVPFLLRVRWSVKVPVALFAASQFLWLASDAVRGFGAPPVAGVVDAAAELLAHTGSAIFTVTIVATVYLRGRPRIETWLDSLIYVAALAPPLWLLVVEPAAQVSGGAWIDAWALSVLALMFAGGLFLISGGIWNAPAIALVAGVIGNFVTDLVLRLADPAAASTAPHFLIGAISAAYVSAHPDMERIFERGGRPSGIPLDTRVWMLAAVLTMPVGALGWTYVQGEQAPILTIGASVGAIAIIVALRAMLMKRAGVPNWSVPLNISMTALLVSSAAIAMTTLNGSAQDAQRRVDRTAELLPRVHELDGLLLRGARDDADAPAARSRWRETVLLLERDEPQLDLLLDRYVSTARSAFDAADAGNATAAAAIADGPATFAQRALSSTIARELEARRGAAIVRARRVRLFSLSLMALTLLTVAGLLLRFHSARRRVDLQYQAMHDELTGLASRTAIDRELAKPLPDGAAGARRALVVVDLDDFRTVNNAHGRDVGDALLVAIARRMEEALRSDHLVARVDGDAFGVLVPPGADALVAAQRALGVLSAPLEIAGTAHALHGSAGIAEVDETDAARRASAFRDAELAMYQAKRVAGTSLEHFSAGMDERVRGRLQLIADLRAALDGEGLHLAYQPIVDLDDGRVRGYEALIRWTHPTRGPLSPADFIPVAEESGLIVDLGGWVLRTATIQMAAWQRDWADARYVSVNVAGAQFTTDALVGQVQQALHESGLAPERLLLEVTESTLIEDIEANVAQVERIRELGVRFALDDFGTGYSSLSYLRRFPVDVVKVDKSFIDSLDDPDGYLLVRAIVDMATSLRLLVVAEGIEDVDQARALQDFGCELGQGFHFSRPVGPLEIQAATGQFTVPVSKRLRAF